MNRYLLLAAALCLAAGLAPPAQGRIVTGPTVVMEPPESGAVAGERYEGRLRILVDREMELWDFTIEGAGWNDLTWTPPGMTMLHPGRPLVVEFTGVPQSASAPLRITAMADDKTVHRTFTVGGAEFERDRSVRSLKPADVPLPPVRGSSLARPQPAGPLVRIDDAPAPEKVRLSHDIRVRGRLAYRRDSSTVMGADGLTVKIYDKDLLVNDLLGTTVTDTEGTFDTVVHWESQIGETYPDLYVEFRTENSEVIVKRWFMVDPYIIAIGPWNDYQGVDLNIGSVLPVEEDNQAIPHLMSNYTRFWRYIHNHGHDTDFLKVHWPEPEEDGARYTRETKTIHLRRSDQWVSGTQSHEFGHHVHHSLAEMPTIDYCNGICDPDEPSDCGHCLWCEEDESIAWTEGVANYISHVIPPTFDALYGTPAIGMVDFEELSMCSRDSAWHEALITEGFTAAVLVDIEDVHVDDDAQTAGFGDRLALGGTVALDLLADYGAMNATAFLRDVMAEYPDQKENLWWTAMNNGYDLDEDPPDGAYTIVCTSGQTPGSTSPNPFLRFYWPRPDDDASGVRGYSVILSGIGPIQPDTVMDQETNTIEFNIESAATYHVCIRTVDWAGRWQDGYTSSGPYYITEPDPRNLVFELQTGWDYYVLPRGTDDTAPQDCTLPTILDGSSPTYWNLFARNEGDLSTGADMIAAVQVDGMELDRVNGGDVGGGLSFLAMNQGPVTIRGGLHTFAGCLDPDGLIDETDESDNAIGKQFTWRPPTVTPGSVYYNALPVPDPTGGWGSVLDPFLIYNCFGMNFSSTGLWNAFLTWSDDPAADYDLRLHEAVESSVGGFAMTTAFSGQPAGWADAVLVNRHQMGILSWDAGIINPALDSASLKYQHTTSTAVAFGDSLSEVMGANEYLFLRELEVEFIENKDISLDLWTDPPQADVLLAWRDSDFATGGILEADAVALTGPDGRAHLDVEAQAEGFTCLMICRQPKDGDADLQVTYRIRPTLPDLEPAHLAGWHAPVVPWPNATATADLIPLPTVLEGGYEQTWYNFAVRNVSPGMAWGAMRFYVGLDGGLGPLNYFHVFDIPGGDAFAVINEGPYTVRGGRHTVVLNLDALDYMEELDEGNNAYGEQYVWSPEWIFDSPVIRPAPPDRTGGWEHLGSGQTAYFNCDGLRSMFTSSFWSTFAVMPGAGSDVDVRLHELTVGVQDGFGANLAHSAWGMGQSDYVLLNGMLSGFYPYDAGVLRISGSEDYTVETRMDTYMPHGATDFGPVMMGAGRILDIYETRLTAGDWHVRLENTDGAVDWGLTLHPGDQAFLSKTDVLQEAAAWYAGPGEDELVSLTMGAEETIAIAVWKVGSSDLPLTGSYILHVSPGGPSPVLEDEIPTVTRVAGAYPNPFNPRTTIEFELARPGHVDLAVYNLSGRRVVTLVRATVSAGRYREVWQGQDDAGRPVASGMYFVRLQADQTIDMKKVMLLK